MSIPQLISENREQILSVAEKHGAKNVRVFGSAARTDFNEQSDVDILLRLDSSKLKGMRYFAVLEQLKDEFETILGRSVDVIDELGLKNPLPEHVLKEAVSL